MNTRDEFKQVIVVRRDIEMSPGKLGAQIAHAAVGACMRTPTHPRDTWMEFSQKKVILAAPDEQTLRDIEEASRAFSVPRYLVADAGRTELEPGTVTCLGLGPWKTEAIDKLTGHLPLY